MEQPVLTDCNHTLVIGSYSYTYVTGRVGYIRVTDLVQCNNYNYIRNYFVLLNETST